MILIKCFDNEIGFFKVNIYHNNKCSMLVSKNNMIKYYPNEKGIYKIKYNSQIFIVLYECNDIIINICSKVFNIKRVITLTDLNYKGLKIKKGEINLNVL